MKYIFDEIFNMHVIEVVSVALYESAEFQAWHDELIAEFAQRYPTEEIGVTTDGLLLIIATQGLAPAYSGAGGSSGLACAFLACCCRFRWPGADGFQ
jgi:galactokinase/mevalonate kinase-like predicted kinase